MAPIYRPCCQELVDAGNLGLKDEGMLPCVTEVHGTDAYWRYFDCGGRGEESVAAEEGLWGWCWFHCWISSNWT